MVIRAVVFDIGDVVLREHDWEARKILIDAFGFYQGCFVGGNLDKWRSGF